MSKGAFWPVKLNCTVHTGTATACFYYFSLSCRLQITTARVTI